MATNLGSLGSFGISTAPVTVIFTVLVLIIFPSYFILAEGILKVPFLFGWMVYVYDCSKDCFPFMYAKLVDCIGPAITLKFLKFGGVKSSAPCLLIENVTRKRSFTPSLFLLTVVLNETSCANNCWLTINNSKIFLIIILCHF